MFSKHNIYNIYWLKIQKLQVYLKYDLRLRCPKHKLPRVWIHYETRMWHEKNIQSNAPYIKVLTTQLNHLVSLAKWLSVRLQTVWLWVRVQMQSLKLQISRRFPARSSLIFRQPYSVDSPWSTYVTWQEYSVKCTVQISTHNSGQSFDQFGQMVECLFTN